MVPLNTLLLASLSSLASLAAAQFGDVVPYELPVAFQCTSATNAYNPFFLNAGATNVPWSLVDPLQAGTNSVFRIYNKSKRDSSVPVMKASNKCSTDSNSGYVSANFNAGDYPTDYLNALSLRSQIRNFSIEWGYMATWYTGNLVGTSRNDLTDVACLNGTSFAGAINSLRIQDLNYIYIASVTYGGYGRLNGNYQIDANAATANGIVYQFWVWEAWKYTSGQLVNPWWGLGLNCDSKGNVTFSSSKSASNVSIIVPTVEAVGNNFTATEDTPRDIKVNMLWQHSQGLFVCNVSITQADVSLIGSLQILNCSSDSRTGLVTNTTTPYFFVRYTPLADYGTGLAKSITYRFNNGPFSFNGTFSIRVFAVNDAPKIDAQPDGLVFLPNEVASINVTVRDPDSTSVSLRIVNGSEVGGTANISSTAIANGTGFWIYNLVFTPSQDYIGNASVSLVASDPSQSSSANTSFVLVYAYASESPSPSVTPTVSPSAAPSPTSLPQASPAAATQGDTSTATSPDAITVVVVVAIVGGVLGGLLLVSAFAALFFYLRQKKDTSSDADSKPGSKKSSGAANPYGNL